MCQEIGVCVCVCMHTTLDSNTRPHGCVGEQMAFISADMKNTLAGSVPERW